MIKKIFILSAMVAFIAVFTSCEKSEVSSEKIEPSKIEAIQEKITDNGVKPTDGSILKSSSNTKTYSTNSMSPCSIIVSVDIPANSDKTVKLEVYENTGIGGSINVASMPYNNVLFGIGNLLGPGYKMTWIVSRSSLGADNRLQVIIRPNGCGYATGKVVLLTY